LELFSKGTLFRQQALLMAGDSLAGVLALAVTMPLLPTPDTICCWRYLFIPLALIVSFLAGLYDAGAMSLTTLFARAVVASALLLVVLLPMASLDAGALWPPLACTLAFAGLQIVWQALYRRARARGLFAKRVLVIGTGPKAKKIEQIIHNIPGSYQLAGYVATAGDPRQVAAEKIVGAIDDVVVLVRRHRADALVIALSERRGNLAIEKLVACKLMGVRIEDYPSFFEALTGKIPVEDISPSWLVHSSGFSLTPFVRVVKRLIDIVLAGALLSAIFPFLIPVALLVKLTSPGPVFYFQQRVGMHGRPFTIYKFRSMTVDAEKHTGATWAKENDPRVTPFGAFMRKTRIDELPQLFNVLKGDMSFIGPRPERPEFVEQISKLTPYYQDRHAVKPGITGWAQVMYPYGASFGDALEKLRYDLYYIKNLSFFLEILIVLETVKVVLLRKGGR